MPNVSNGLTEKMKHFAREYYANGGNGTEAYLAAYDTTSKTTAYQESCKLLKREDINQYIKALNIPYENKAISERQKKRDILWNMINNSEDESIKLRAMDILNKMDAEYININKNIDENKENISQLDTDSLKKLVSC